MTTPHLDLSSHTGRNYSKGRSVFWQVLWHATSNLVFKKWWFPSRFRPALLRAFGAKVDDSVNIREDVRIHWPWRLTIDGPAWVGQGAWILNLEQVTIARDVCLSQEALLCTGSHDRHDPAFEHTNAPITLERGAWVCARTTVLAGTVVGEHAIVGAGAVVHGFVAPSSRVTQVARPSASIPTQSNSSVSGLPSDVTVTAGR